MSKVLIAYFNASGTTAKVVESLANDTVIKEGKVFRSSVSANQLKAFAESVL